MLKKTILLVNLVLISSTLLSQIAYTHVTNQKVSLGSYGRVGVDWSYENGGSIGRSLNLNSMGSIGGRMEEMDYMELAPAFHFMPFDDNDVTEINLQMRFSLYSKSLARMGYENTFASSGLGISLPEMFVEARNIGGSDINVWVGARLYRGPDVHIADHFYFNDHSGQGFGVEYRNTRMGALLIASSDTSSTLPPYFYLNIATGTPGATLRQRSKFFLEHDFHLSETQTLTGLLEGHFMGDGSFGELEEDSLAKYQYPSDLGYVIGARLTSKFQAFDGLSNQLALRLGKGIANGGDGGMSRTYMTFGTPDLEERNFRKAYSVAIVDEVFAQINEDHSLSAYIIYTNSRGAGASNGLEETYYGKTIYNKKEDFTLGFRESYAMNKYFKLLTEVHHSRRKDGDNDWAAVTKFSLVPTLVPTGDKDFWARPEIRLVASIAFYNQFAADTQYSPFLATVGSQKFGHYFGVKAEWWLW